MPSVGSSSNSNRGAPAERTGQRQQLLLAARQRAARPVQQAARSSGNSSSASASACSRGRRFANAAEVQVLAHRQPGKDLRAPAARSRCRRARAGAARVLSTGRHRRARCRAMSATARRSLRSSVDLPMPLWPRMPTHSPAATAQRNPVQHADAAVAGARDLPPQIMPPPCRDRRRARAGRRTRSRRNPRSARGPGGTPSRCVAITRMNCMSCSTTTMRVLRLSSRISSAAAQHFLVRSCRRPARPA